jgi:hypothetical protein
MVSRGPALAPLQPLATPPLPLPLPVPRRVEMHAQKIATADADEVRPRLGSG